MADLADATQEIIEFKQAAIERSIRNAARNIQKGEPGVCDECGLYKERLVEGICASCRDQLAADKKQRSRNFYG